MNEAPADSAFSAWRVPECPFAVEYAPGVLEDIRLAVVDAFCSLPRGGAEIGGILMGRFQSGRLRISGYAQLDCEHAHGPSFTLSVNDEARLRELISRAPAEFPGLLPAGWYHSHTRSGIFLSEADLVIHDRFFREPWQVALVLKPHMMQPTRAGFFFRDTSGAIHAAASYQEFSIEARPMLPAPAGAGREMPLPEGRPRTIRMERNPVIGVTAKPAGSTPDPCPAQPAPKIAEPEPQQAQLELQPAAETAEPQPGAERLLAPPSFLTVEPPSRNWLGPLLILCATAAVAAGAYYSHEVWLPKVTAAVRSSPAASPHIAPPLHFTAIEREGQLQINWDPGVSAVLSAVNATLEITDGSHPPHAITLDQAHLQNGFFTYARQSERIDMKLVLHEPDGTQVREVTTFLGALPERKQPEENPGVRKQRDELAAQASKLQTDLEHQAARTRKLEKDLQGMRDEMRQQQQRRMNNMLPEGK